jgi:acetyltransferase-like isoleucine patch superfamily enzyme
MRQSRVPAVRKARALARRLLKTTQLTNTTRRGTNKVPDYGNGNKVINHPKLERSQIVFRGKNNILYCESPDTRLKRGKIVFQGDNAVLYLSKRSNTKREYHFKILVGTKSAVYIGENVNFHPVNPAYIVASEGKNVVIGDECLFSLGLLFRTSDGHAAYDSITKKRINQARSVLVGDHVWLGQNVTLLKGSRIGSGSIIGAGSVVTGKTFRSNTSCAGIPARELSEGVFFSRPNINDFTGKQLDAIETEDTEKWIYQKDSQTLDFDKVDSELSAAPTSAKKLAVIKKYLATEKHSKNRFFISEGKTPSKK